MKSKIIPSILSFLCAIIVFSTFSGCIDSMNKLFLGNKATNNDITLSKENTTTTYVFTVIPHHNIEHLEITIYLKDINDKAVTGWEFYIAPIVIAGEAYTFSLERSKVDKYYGKENIVWAYNYAVTSGTIVE